MERRRQLLQLAVSRRTGDPGLLMTLGITYWINRKLTDKETDEHRYWDQAAVAAAPGNAAAHNMMGVTMKEKGQLDEAIVYFLKAIEIDPKSANAHSNLGALLCDDKRDYDGAIAWFHKAIDIDPRYADAHSNLGTALRFKGQLDEAIASYKKAIDLD